MTDLLSFDGTERATAEVLHPADTDAIRAVFADHDRVAIRGSGLSYCLASGRDAAPSATTDGLDRIIGIDHAASTVHVEAGVTIGALVEHLVAHDLWFPVLPGHPRITVGGCVAFNTHGKTQHDIGQFVDHVVELTVLHPDHGSITCSPSRNDELFYLTVGGFGLTGWIVDVVLRVEPLAGRGLRRRAHTASDLGAALEIMRSLDADGVHLYSWNDGNRRGAGFGRGVVYEESFETDGPKRRGRYRNLEAQGRGRWVPRSAWTRLTTSIVNTAYFELERRRPSRVMSVLDAAFPINGKEGYFHAYGRPGFFEYQLIVPDAAWSTATDRIRAAIDRTGACVPLMSLKLFRGEPRHLWFRGDGVCVTIDGPATDATRRLFAELDELAIELEASVNLAKDSRIDAATVARIFPGYEAFRAAIERHDPAGRIDSELRRRIDV